MSGPRHQSGGGCALTRLLELKEVREVTAARAPEFSGEASRYQPKASPRATGRRRAAGRMRVPAALHSRPARLGAQHHAVVGPSRASWEAFGIWHLHVHVLDPCAGARGMQEGSSSAPRVQRKAPA